MYFECLRYRYCLILIWKIRSRSDRYDSYILNGLKILEWSEQNILETVKFGHSTNIKNK